MTFNLFKYMYKTFSVFYKNISSLGQVRVKVLDLRIAHKWEHHDRLDQQPPPDHRD